MPFLQTRPSPPFANGARDSRHLLNQDLQLLGCRQQVLIETGILSESAQGAFARIDTPQ